MEPAFYESTPAPVEADPDTLDLFDVPDIRTPAPVAPGSETSQTAALLASPFRRKSWRSIMLTLGTLSPDAVLSREELSERTGIYQHVLCARLSELRPFWVEAVAGACVSAAGVTVDGYRLTAAGRARLVEAA